jgi:hypothetical protein
VDEHRGRVPGLEAPNGVNQLINLKSNLSFPRALDFTSSTGLEPAVLVA